MGWVSRALSSGPSDSMVLLQNPTAATPQPYLFLVVFVMLAKAFGYFGKDALHKFLRTGRQSRHENQLVALKSSSIPMQALGGLPFLHSARSSLLCVSVRSVSV